MPTVIFISYLGSRGNRAKWIGAGTVLMAMAHIFTATPNFIFPAEQPKLNLTTIEVKKITTIEKFLLIVQTSCFEKKNNS